MRPRPRPSPRQIEDETRPKLEAILQAWRESLPEEAAYAWRWGAVYIRESTVVSTIGDAPEMQLRNTLALLRSKHIYVPPNGLFFDVASGTTTNRHDFQRLFDAALAGGFRTIGVAAADRLFRSQADAIEVRAEFRRHDIDLEYYGRFEGDVKDVAYWQLTAVQDMQAEAQARMASQAVGRHFEMLSRMGRPVSKTPEVYVATAWGPDFLGRPGPVVAWAVQEPLGEVIEEGCRRFLDGDSLVAVAEWAKTTTLGGKTPGGREMNRDWWRTTLRNPRFAGQQHPTVWPGFKPSREERARARAEAQRQLVPCILPALWDAGTHARILAEMTKRSKGRKERARYRAYLLVGVAYDSVCQHRLAITGTPPSGSSAYSMACTQASCPHRKGRHMRADVAAREVDEVIGSLQFDDPELVAAVEAALRHRIDAANEGAQTFRENAKISPLKLAIATLANIREADGVRDELERQLGLLEACDDDLREILAQPVLEFRQAMAELENWGQVWVDNDLRKKNKFLRSAGVQAFIGRDEGVTRGAAHVQRITSPNPVFALALAVGLQRLISTFADERGVFPSNVEIKLELSADVADVASIVGADDARFVPVHLPRAFGHERLPDLAQLPGRWLTTREVARRVGLTQWEVWHALVSAELMGERMPSLGKRTFWYVEERELERFAVTCAPPTPDHIPYRDAPARTGVPASTLKSWRRRRGLTVIEGGRPGKESFVDIRDIERLKTSPKRKSGPRPKAERRAA